MKHSISSFEAEIVQQILICEICFETCHSIPGFPGLGSHFLPYFYNINYQKGVGLLHSLLLSNEQNELSLKNYIKLHKQKSLDKNLIVLEEGVKKIAEDFKNLAQFSLRNKIGSHLDGDFAHKDFAGGYLMPNTLDGLIEITQQLKQLFFPFVNHSLNDNPYYQLSLQIHKVVDEFTIEESKKIIAKNNPS